VYEKNFQSRTGDAEPSTLDHRPAILILSGRAFVLTVIARLDRAIPAGSGVCGDRRVAPRSRARSPGDDEDEKV